MSDVTELASRIGNSKISKFVIKKKKRLLYCYNMNGSVAGAIKMSSIMSSAMTL